MKNIYNQLDTSDRLLVLSLGLNVVLLLLHKYGSIPTPIEWALLGVVCGLGILGIAQSLYASLWKNRE
jgi:hypothetical protein